jgi:putative PIN family toxin of toxin-antitoxin system
LRLASEPGSLILSDYILEEVERVLFYPRLLKQFQLSDLEIAAHIDALSQASILVEPAPVPESLLRDPKDKAVLGTAIAGNVDVLCTMDRHFFDEKVVAFAASHGIRIMNDVELLAVLDAEP